MLKRKIEKILDEFLLNRKALLIPGARQVGKTYSVTKFGHENFENFIKIDFIENPDAQGLFDGEHDADVILSRISLLTDIPMVPGKTLIMFDEVQKAPGIVTAIKYLVDDGRYRYILTGSLLGVELSDVYSVPVGFMDTVPMYPLDFEEFISALGVSEKIISSIHEAYRKRVPMDQFVHEQLMKLIRLYMVIGGMPQAVETYIRTNDFRAVKNDQMSILEQYRWDISKYEDEPESKLHIKEVFDIIPQELSAMNKRFILADLDRKRFETYKRSFKWLTDAGAAIAVYNAEEPLSPLKLSASRTLFKLFASDVGLLCGMFDGLDVQIDMVSGGGNANYGALFENYAAQELLAHGFQLYYYNSKKYGELDFMVERNMKVIPLEIKSGKNYTRHRAIENVMDVEGWNIEEGLVFCPDNVHQNGKITYLPIYMIGCLEREKTERFVMKPDLSGLI